MLIAAMVLVGVQAAAPASAPAPSAEAVALGERLARRGTLSTLLPLQAGKETDEMIAANPSLSAAEQARFRQVAATTRDAMAARLFAAEGRRYAELLSLADLATLVAQAESPAAARLRAAQPQVIMAAMSVMGNVDFKKDVMTAYCRAAGAAGGATCAAMDVPAGAPRR